MFALLALVLMALAVAAVVSVAAFVFRMAFWLVFLPFRLLFGLLIVPFWIARVGGLLAAAALIATIVAVISPLLPLLIVGFLIWVVVRSFSRRGTAIAT